MSSETFFPLEKKASGGRKKSTFWYKNKLFLSESSVLINTTPWNSMSSNWDLRCLHQFMISLKHPILKVTGAGSFSASLYIQSLYKWRLVLFFNKQKITNYVNCFRSSVYTKIDFFFLCWFEIKSHLTLKRLEERVGENYEWFLFKINISKFCISSSDWIQGEALRQKWGGSVQAEPLTPLFGSSYWSS